MTFSAPHVQWWRWPQWMSHHHNLLPSHPALPSFSSTPNAKLNWCTIASFSYPSCGMHSPISLLYCFIFSCPKGTGSIPFCPYYLLILTLYPFLTPNLNSPSQSLTNMWSLHPIHHLNYIDTLLGQRYRSFISVSLIQSIMPTPMIKDLCPELWRVNGWRCLRYGADLGAGWGSASLQESGQTTCEDLSKYIIPPMSSKLRSSSGKVMEELTLDEVLQETNNDLFLQRGFPTHNGQILFTLISLPSSCAQPSQFPWNLTIKPFPNHSPNQCLYHCICLVRILWKHIIGTSLR